MTIAFKNLLKDVFLVQIFTQCQTAQNEAYGFLYSVSLPDLSDHATKEIPFKGYGQKD